MNFENNKHYKTICENIKIGFPPQHQSKQPGLEYLMNPQPVFDDPDYIATGKLKGKVAIITGGDSGIGRAVAVLFAKEGANIVISYLNEHEDANNTKNYIESLGRPCLLLSGDIRNEAFSTKIVQDTIMNFGKIDIIINNSGISIVQNSIENISAEQLYNVFATNVFSYFYLVKAALPHLKKGSVIINTASSSAFVGFPALIDYSASKSAVVNFTYTLAMSLVNKGIRVNGVAPGSTWTPLIPSTLSAVDVEVFGSNTPMERPAQPIEIAPIYLYLASDESSFVTGQTMRVDGGTTPL